MLGWELIVGSDFMLLDVGVGSWLLALMLCLLMLGWEMVAGSGVM
jgi:hypothetical protein